MQVLKYKKIIYNHYIQVRYMIDIVLPKLLETISYSETTYSTLINIYRDAYYGNVCAELDAQREIFTLHLNTLQGIYTEYKEELKTIDTLEFDEDIKVFDHEIMVAISKVTTLIKKIDIETKKLQGKQNVQNK